jgi:hypothetical protein
MPDILATTLTPMEGSIIDKAEHDDGSVAVKKVGNYVWDTSNLTWVRTAGDASGNPQVDVVSATGFPQLTVANAITTTAYNLNAAPYSTTSAITNDYIIDHIQFNFTTTESRDITVTAGDGTVIWAVTGDISSNILLEDIDKAFNANDNFTIAVTQTSGACAMDVLATIFEGTSTLGGNPVLDSSSIVGVRATDSPSIDAFGRWRVSSPYTIFDSKNIYDDADIADNTEQQPLQFDNAETSGSGTSTAYMPNKAAQSISVSASTAGTRVRQTKRRFNYQPGKSLLLFLTFLLGNGAAGITKREGYFDENNGIFLEQAGTSVKFVRRTNTSGTPTDNSVSQANWNIDTMDGGGASGINLDWSKTQIMIMDMEWLGVGRVRCGFVVGGNIYYAHEFLNANVLDVVYMSTPNLPVRSEISNSGAGGAATMHQICSTVISEGGFEDNGIVFSDSNNNTHVEANVAGTFYACIGMKLKPTHLAATIKILSANIFSPTVNDNFQWKLLLNPSIGGVFTYANIANSAVMTAKGATANTVTGGTLINSGYGAQQTSISTALLNSLNLGSNIDGTSDTIVLAVSPIGSASNLDIYSSITWRELL